MRETKLTYKELVDILCILKINQRAIIDHLNWLTEEMLKYGMGKIQDENTYTRSGIYKRLKEVEEQLSGLTDYLTQKREKAYNTKKATKYTIK
jgi:hypothetical protein